MFGIKTEKNRPITLEDVTPLHPLEYPAKHLREKLAERHELLEEMKYHSQWEGHDHRN